MAELAAVVHGEVQGVGMRWWIGRRAGEIGVRAAGENLPDGTVRLTASGERAGLHQLLADLREGTGGRPGRVDRVEETGSGADG